MENNMMNKPFRISVFLTACTMLLIMGCASSANQSSTGEYFDDATITTKVKAAIFQDENLKSAQINVETFKGVVQLSGFVSSQAEINKAVEVAKAVKGVSSVKNDMRLR
jgi:osmotically-inducible protein OsmY